MKRMSEQTLEEFKKETFEYALRSHLELGLSLEKTLEFVFEQAHVRGEWAGSKGIIE